MLDISNGSGEFTPWVKYNAKAGRWYIRGESGDVEVQSPTFVADFTNIKTGWFYYSAGQAPQQVLDPSLTERAPKPEHGDFKRGFVLNLFSNDSFGGVVELSATSASLSGPINELYSDFEKNSKDGKLPVVEFVRADAVTGNHGTNYTPVFKVVKYVDRPAELDNAPGKESNVSVEEAAPMTGTSGASEF